MSADAHRFLGGPLVTSRSERVELAWHRSGLAFAAIGVALLERELPNIPARPAAAVWLIAGGSLAALVAVLYRTGLRRHQVSYQTEMLLVAMGAAALAVLAFAVSIVG